MVETILPSPRCKDTTTSVTSLLLLILTFFTSPPLLPPPRHPHPRAQTIHPNLEDGVYKQTASFIYSNRSLSTTTNNLMELLFMSLCVLH